MLLSLLLLSFASFSFQRLQSFKQIRGQILDGLSPSAKESFNEIVRRRELGEKERNWEIWKWGQIYNTKERGSLFIELETNRRNIYKAKLFEKLEFLEKASSQVYKIIEKFGFDSEGQDKLDQFLSQSTFLIRSLFKSLYPSLFKNHLDPQDFASSFGLHDNQKSIEAVRDKFETCMALLERDRLIGTDYNRRLIDEILWFQDERVGKTLKKLLPAEKMLDRRRF